MDPALTFLLARARAAGRDIAIVSDYGFSTVDRPVHINRVLREAGFMDIEVAANGDQILMGTSSSFAVCDIQVAHVYVRASEDNHRVPALLSDIEHRGCA